MGYIETVIEVSQDQFTGMYGVEILLYEYRIRGDWSGLRVERELKECRAVEVYQDSHFECESEYEASIMRNAVEVAFNKAKDIVNEDPEYAAMVFDYDSIAQYQMATVAY